MRWTGGRKLQECYAWSVGTFEYFDHAADVGIAVEARSLPDLFVTAARGLMEWIGPPPGGCPSRTERIRLEAEDLGELLVRWLQELLYQFHRCRCYWLEVNIIEATERTVGSTITGSAWDDSSGRTFQEIKAVTYHQVQVVKENGVWRARVILDI